MNQFMNHKLKILMQKRCLPNNDDLRMNVKKCVIARNNGQRELNKKFTLPFRLFLTIDWN